MTTSPGLTLGNPELGIRVLRPDGFQGAKIGLELLAVDDLDLYRNTMTQLLQSETRITSKIVFTALIRAGLKVFDGSSI